MPEPIGTRIQIAVLLALSAGSSLAGLQLAFGALPEPASTGQPKGAPALAGVAVASYGTSPPLALHLQARGAWQRWALTPAGTRIPLQLSLIPINVRNRLDLSITAITSNDPGLKNLVLKQRRERTITGTPPLKLAIGQLSGPTGSTAPRTAAQTCVVMPSPTHRHGATGIHYEQLVKAIVARNSALSEPRPLSKVAGFAGLGPQGRWSCLFVSLSAAGRGKAIEQQLIHTLQQLIGDLTSQAR